MKKIISFYLYSLIILQSLFAQTDSSQTMDLLNLNLEKLVTTPSKVKFTLEETPGVVTVISEKEIKNMGANDLMDVLKTVPGINFNVDVNGVIGIGMRGNWGHEGKILLLMDGLQLNELLFGNNVFGGHFDINQIKRIEIVRGPGSSIYGGFAELGVINIITKKGEDLTGIEINTGNGVYRKANAFNNLSIQAGNQNNKYQYSISGFISNNNRSNSTYTDIYGNSSSLNNKAISQNAFLNSSFNYGNLSAKVILDKLWLSSPINYDTLLKQNISVDFININSELLYKYNVNSKFTLTPKIQYIRQYPWYNINPYPTTNINTLAEKHCGNIEIDYNPNKKVNIISGFEYFDQIAHNYNIAVSPLFTNNNSDKLSNNTYSIYSQGTVKHKLANITLGGRYLFNNLFGKAFSPRIALTKAFENIHFKLMYSNAFKTPTLMNIGLNPNIKPEKTDVIEFETGYKVNDDIELFLNAYYIKIKDPIIYEYLNNNDTYLNQNQTGTTGLEASIKYNNRIWHILLNYSFYNADNLNKVDNYSIPQNTSQLLGFAHNNGNLIITRHISDNLSINTNLNYIGERYAYQYGSIEAGDIPLKTPSTFLWNIFINQKINNFSLGIGINNILNQKMYLVQPYNSYNAPLPYYNQMLYIKLGYKLNKV